MKSQESDPSKTFLVIQKENLLGIYKLFDCWKKTTEDIFWRRLKFYVDYWEKRKVLKNLLIN